MDNNKDENNAGRFDISVRALAEHVHRTGGLSSLSFSGISGAEGTRLHNRVFADLKNQYQPASVETEFSLSAERDEDDITLSIRGRADCILHQTLTDGKDEITLVEIKS